MNLEELKLQSGASYVVVFTFLCQGSVVCHLIWQGPGYDPGVDASRFEEKGQGIERSHHTAHSKYGTESCRFDFYYQVSDAGMRLERTELLILEMRLYYK